MVARTDRQLQAETKSGGKRSSWTHIIHRNESTSGRNASTRFSRSSIMIFLNGPKRRILIGLCAILLAGVVAVIVLRLRPSASSSSYSHSSLPSALGPAVIVESTSAPYVGSTTNPIIPINSNILSASPSMQRPILSTRGRFQVLYQVAHNVSSFTQGLCLVNGTTLFESTGLYGQSVVQTVDLDTGDTILQTRLDDQYFGEGLTHYYNNNESNHTTLDNNGGRLVQITWQERTGFVYDATTLEVLDRFSFSTDTGEGWGITTTTHSNVEEAADIDELFVVSDGSNILYFWNSTFDEIRRIEVTFQFDTMEQPKPVSRLNELEWDPHTGSILANVWYNDIIIRVDALTGGVRTVYDLRSLYPQEDRPPSADVLNGIAVTDDEPNVVWVTGKQWPFMYQIRLID